MSVERALCDHEPSIVSLVPPNRFSGIYLPCGGTVLWRNVGIKGVSPSEFHTGNSETPGDPQ